MTTVLAATDAGGELGALALYLTFAWLASAIVCAYLSDRKGYGERPGLASGLLLNVVGIVDLGLLPGEDHVDVEDARPMGLRAQAARP